jgi:hypothetical protein
LLCVFISLAIAAFVTIFTMEDVSVGIALFSLFVCFGVIGLFITLSCRGCFATDDLATCVQRDNVAASDWMIRKGAVLHPALLSTDNLRGDSEMARMLIGHFVAADTDVDVKVRQFVRPLLVATIRDDIAMAKLLLESGADVNLGNQELPTKRPIFYASSRKMAQLLVEAGADIAAFGGDDGQSSVLLLAVDFQRFELVDYMADVMVRKDIPFEPVRLHFVRAEVVGAFVRLGSDVDDVGGNCRGATPLHMAVICEDVPKLRVLLACNASVDAQMPIDCPFRRMMTTSAAMPTPIELARNVESAAYLLAAGSKRGACTFEPSEDAIADAARQIARQRLDLIRARAFEICVALDSLELPALLMCMILDVACAPFAVCVPLHTKWDFVVAVKHRKKFSSARSDSDNDSDSWIVDIDR